MTDEGSDLTPLVLQARHMVSEQADVLLSGAFELLDAAFLDVPGQFHVRRSP